MYQYSGFFLELIYSPYFDEFSQNIALRLLVAYFWLISLLIFGKSINLQNDQFLA